MYRPAAHTMSTVSTGSSDHAVNTRENSKGARSARDPASDRTTTGSSVGAVSRCGEHDHRTEGVRGGTARPNRHNEPVATTAAAIPASRLHGHHDRPSMVSVGTTVWLASELMFFAALFAGSSRRRAASPELWAQETAKLNVPCSAVNTPILVLSSVTCQLGVFK